jgi:phosphatidylserine/phosphatidylglycerophosphate/cardiolipin synthase-like enzyme
MQVPHFLTGHGKRDGGEAAVIRPGDNAWRTARADKLGFMIDAADYFARLEQVLRQAERSIWILGWDFNSDIYLRPDRPSEQLGELLFSIVEARPDLEIRVLIWSMGPIYSGKSLDLFRDNTWSTHPRIHLHFDSVHPLRGSHHQKLVVVDEAIAFIGGIDLTARRWDDSRHLAENPLRISPSGDSYEPVHDLQAAVTGAAARSLADLARRRWQRATGVAIEPHPPVHEVWPQDLDSDLGDCTLGISLTEPGFNGRRSRRQAMKLTLDALQSARRHIYVETQYFAFFGLASSLERQLQRPGGPEVVIVLTRASHGLLEKLVMGGNRNRLIRRLKRADRFGRFRVMYPVVPAKDGTEQDVLVHSKLLIIDDRFLKLGSSNLNNRSEGLDTEADIAVEASDPQCQAAIAGLRNRLFAEHLDVSQETVERAIAETGSLIAAIDRLNVKPRGLRDIELDVARGSVEPIPGTDLVDPRRPYWPLQRLRDEVGSVAERLTGIFL